MRPPASPFGRAKARPNRLRRLVEPWIVCIEGSNPSAAIFLAPALRAAAKKMAEREGLMRPPASPFGRAKARPNRLRRLVEPWIVCIEGSNPSAAIFLAPALRAAAKKMAEREGFEPSMRG